MASKQILKECHLFDGLNGAALDRIADLAQTKEYDAGATIFSEGSPADDLFIVASGRVALQMQLRTALPQSSKRVTVDVVGPHDVFGWSAAIEHREHSLAAVCLEPVGALAIGGPKLRSLLKADQQIGYEVLSGLIKVVASRLDETRHVLISERMVSV
ncbi:MAG: cyclic nucleotide-binding domain-containing protein [Chloroflexi bacterium]|nr:cyclic nucleotide-binding domain-containing protein [Chloroflexota bacterium]